MSSPVYGPTHAYGVQRGRQGFPKGPTETTNYNYDRGVNQQRRGYGVNPVGRQGLFGFGRRENAVNPVGRMGYPQRSTETNSYGYGNSYGQSYGYGGFKNPKFQGNPVRTYTFDGPSDRANRIGRVGAGRKNWGPPTPLEVRSLGDFGLGTRRTPDRYGVNPVARQGRAGFSNPWASVNPVGRLGYNARVSETSSFNYDPSTSYRMAGARRGRGGRAQRTPWDFLALMGRPGPSPSVRGSAYNPFEGPSDRALRINPSHRRQNTPTVLEMRALGGGRSYGRRQGW